MLNEIIANPLLVGAVVPLCVGALIAAAIRAGVGRGISSLAVVGALAAFLFTYMMIEGAPALLPVTAKQKLFWLAVAGGAIGLAIDISDRGRAVERALLVLFPAACILWFGERQWLRGPDTGFAVMSVLLWLGGAAILLRLRATSTASRGFKGGAQLVVAAVGLSVIALLGASASLATLTGALAAGLGGVLLVDYAIGIVTGAPTAMGAIGRLGVAGTLISLTAILLLFTEGVSAIAVAILSLVFVSGRIPLRIGWSNPLAVRIGEPIRATLLAAIPAAIAVGVAALQADLTAYP